MALSYSWRLFCLAFAIIFLVRLVAAVGVHAFSPAAIRMAGRVRPRVGARLVLALRMLPLALALLVVLGGVIPSYLWWEPEGGDERVGFACMLAAATEAWLWAAALARAARALWMSIRFSWDCRREGNEVVVGGRGLSVVPGARPLVLLSGVLRCRVVLSEAIFRGLTEAELGMVILHEHAHESSRDNLKRLAIRLQPEIPPVGIQLRMLEEAWMRLSEYAADERAADGDVRRAVTLAAALVRVARAGESRDFGLAAAFVAEQSDLSVRIDRLLNPGTSVGGASSVMRWGGVFVFLVCLAPLAIRPAFFREVQILLERVIR